MMRNVNVADEAKLMSDGELAATIAVMQGEQRRRAACGLSHVRAINDMMPDMGMAELEIAANLIRAEIAIRGEGGDVNPYGTRAR